MSQQHVHKLIAQTAKEFAAAVYEDMAKDNAFYKAWPSQRNFVRAHWTQFVKPAREQLAKMLGGNYPQIMKDEIAEALIADRSLHGADRPSVH